MERPTRKQQAAINARAKELEQQQAANGDVYTPTLNWESARKEVMEGALAGDVSRQVGIKGQPGSFRTATVRPGETPRDMWSRIRKGRGARDPKVKMDLTDKMISQQQQQTIDALRYGITRSATFGLGAPFMGFDPLGSAPLSSTVAMARGRR